MFALLVALALAQPVGGPSPILSRPPPIPSAPWAYWSLSDAVDGTMVDLGPNHLGLAVTQDDAGYPQRVGPWRFFSRRQTTGSNSQAANFGENGAIPAAVATLVQGPALTVGFSYVRAPMDGGSGQDTVLAIGTNSPPFNFDVLSFSSYRTSTCPNEIGLTWLHTDAGNVTTCFTSYTVVDNVGFHATVVLAPTSSAGVTPRLYINGVLTQSQAERGVPRFFTVAGLDGGYAAVSHRAHATVQTGQVGGYLRNVSVYPRVLTASEIVDLAAQ